MGRSLSALRGPQLFASCFGRGPASFTRKTVLDLHKAVETNVRATFRQVGGPELPPIFAQALPRNDFRREVPGDIFFNKIVCPMPDVSTGELKWDFIYNLDYLSRHARAAGENFGELLLSQIIGTIYGPWLEKLLVREDFTSLGEIQKACSGWAGYFTQIPRSPEEILENEQIAVSVVAPEHMKAAAPILRGMFGDPRFFIPLTLFKLERARAFEAVVELMHRPPGIEETGDGCKLANVMGAFWRIYKSAKDQLGEASLHQEMVIKGSVTSEN